MAEPDSDQKRRIFTGLLVGTAVGDSIGLPREGLTPQRAQRMFGGAPLRQRLFFGRGFCSDDTEHAILCAEALLVSRGDPERFATALASRLRWWIASLPGGVGLATLRSGLRLWFGVPPSRSGVFSAGNGPAMRAPIIGAFAAGNRKQLKRLVKVSTLLTHTDPKAEHGALAIALAAEHAVLRQNLPQPSELFETLRTELTDATLFDALEKVHSLLKSNASLQQFQEAFSFSRGVSGYMYHTVPAVLFCWLRGPGNFRAVIEDVVALGGDSDTTGAIAGALAGANLGADAVPAEWKNNLLEWTDRKPQIPKLSTELAKLSSGKEISEWRDQLVGLRRLPRNLFFAAVILCHGFRRLLPPY